MKFTRLSTLVSAAALAMAMLVSSAAAMAQQYPPQPPPDQQQPYPPQPPDQQQPYQQQQPPNQPPPPGRYPGCNEIPGRTIVGTVIYFYAFDMQVRGCDGRRYQVHLHQGTIIWPTGITLGRGMPVWVQGSFGPYGFEAYRIVVRR